jgi:ubiquinone/menaquinone biosynthesis C-methylase UbiE
MDVKQAYNIWAVQYDTNNNKTRDLEAIALRTTVANFQFENCLEVGCGTGKNTEWLATKAKHVTAIDFSEEMLARAIERINSDSVQFYQADIRGEWNFVKKQFDLVTFSLVLEHIEDLEDILSKVSKSTTPNGYVYIGELHPFKQYGGTKARFDTEAGQQVVTCFNHNISDFTQSAKNNGFSIMEVNRGYYGLIIMDPTIRS